MCNDDERCVCTPPIDEFWIDRFQRAKDPTNGRRCENFQTATERLLKLMEE